MTSTPEADQIGTADLWARQTASLPLAFSQVREDPRLDLQVLSQLPADPVVVMIASGGETAIQIGRQSPRELHLVDMNASQLALSRLKWQLATTSSSGTALRLLGYEAMDVVEREAQLRGLLIELQLSEEIFGPIRQVAEWGPDYSGRYERTFVQLQCALKPIQQDLARVMETTCDVSADSIFDKSGWEFRIFDEAFSNVMSLANLVQLFGHDATQNPKQSFARHFAWRTRECLLRPDRNRNPFLWQLLRGCFPEQQPYDWLLPDSGMGRSIRVVPKWHNGRMVDVLAQLDAQSVDLIQISNILDWLSSSQATETLHYVERALKPGGKVIIRQLNSTLIIPELKCHLQWHDDLGQQLAAQDRSFFYPAVYVGTKR